MEHAGVPQNQSQPIPVPVCNVLAGSWCGSALISRTYESNPSQALTLVPWWGPIIAANDGSWQELWVHDWCVKTIQQLQVVNHTNKCPIHFIIYNRDTITLLTNYARWPSMVVIDALTTWSFLIRSSDTSGYQRGALQRTQPVKNRYKTRIILQSKVQKLTVSILNGGQTAPGRYG